MTGETLRSLEHRMETDRLNLAVKELFQLGIPTFLPVATSSSPKSSPLKLQLVLCGLSPLMYCH